MTTQANLYVNKGTDFSIDLEITYELNPGDVFTLDDKAFYSSFRKHYSTAVVANAEITVLSSANNIIEFAIPAEKTENIDSGNYVYDIVMVNPSGDKTKILEGVLKIVSTVTQV
jgi:hypothetical protein